MQTFFVLFVHFAAEAARSVDMLTADTYCVGPAQVFISESFLWL